MMMKKVLGLLFIAFITIGSINAQDKCFWKGNILLNPGIGLGSNYGYGFGRVAPSFFFSADFGVHDYVSVGPYVGTTFFRDKNRRDEAVGVDFGGRVNFHWWQLLDDKVDADLKQSQLELYATFWDGYEMYRRSRNDYARFDVGFTQGIRWYPNSNKRFALYGEFG